MRRRERMCDHVIPCLTDEDHLELTARERNSIINRVDRAIVRFGWIVIVAGVLYFGWHIALYLQGGHP